MKQKVRGERPFYVRNLLFEKDKNGKPKVPSEKAVPDKALKVKDVIDRFTRGLPVENTTGARPIYPQSVSHDSPDMNRLAMMDRNDKMDLARSGTKKFKNPPEVKKADEKKDDKKSDRSDEKPLPV